MLPDSSTIPKPGDLFTLDGVRDRAWLPAPISRATLFRWIKNGTLRTLRIAGRRYTTDSWLMAALEAGDGQRERSPRRTAGRRDASARRAMKELELAGF